LTSENERENRQGGAESKSDGDAHDIFFITRQSHVDRRQSPAYKAMQEVNMAKLRHIAFISKEPKKLSDFYRKHFGFEECKVFPSGSRMVIDPLQPGVSAEPG
jgi:hypothetical protein